MYLSPLQVLLGEADLAAFRWGLTSLCCRSYCWFASIAEENWLRVYGAEYLQGSLLTFPNQRVSVTCVFLLAFVSTFSGDFKVAQVIPLRLPRRVNPKVLVSYCYLKSTRVVEAFQIELNLVMIYLMRAEFELQQDWIACHFRKHGGGLTLGNNLHDFGYRGVACLLARPNAALGS